jgi:hypothetical protein
MPEIAPPVHPVLGLELLQLASHTKLRQLDSQAELAELDVMASETPLPYMLFTASQHC